MLHIPQRTLTLMLIGQTSKVEVKNTVKLDVSSALHWFLLSHSVSCSKVQVDTGSAIYSAMGRELLLQMVSDDDRKVRIVKETLRFASKDGNIERLLRCLSLKQIDEVLKNPLTFKRLIVDRPLTFTATRWFAEGKPDLVTLGIVPNSF